MVNEEKVNAVNVETADKSKQPKKSSSTLMRIQVADQEVLPVASSDDMVPCDELKVEESPLASPIIVAQKTDRLSLADIQEEDEEFLTEDSVAT